MKIIIISAGIYGHSMSEKLSQEGHDITVIDQDEQRIEALKANLDVFAIMGNGTNINILKEANIKQADMLIAVTDKDEVNILSCIMAQYYNVKTKIARMTNPELACAQEFKSLIMTSGIIEEVAFADEKISLVGCKIKEDASILGRPLKDIGSEEVLTGVRFVAISRQGNVIIPRGEDSILKDDILYFMCAKKIVNDVLVWLNVRSYVPSRVVICGASNTGVFLAKLLEEEKIGVKLIEEDAKRADFVSQILPKTMVFNGSPTDEDLFSNVEVPDVDAFVSVTLDDEDNVLSCVLAKQMLAKKTFALIRKAKYVDLVSSMMKVDGVINPRRVTVNSILRFIRKGKLASATSLRELNAEVMEVIIEEHAKVIGKKIVDLKFPKEAIIGAIIRDGNPLFATGDYVLQEGDHVLVLLLPSVVSKVESIFSRKLFRIF